MAASEFIQQAYIAFFNRPADDNGFYFWLTHTGPDQDLLDLFAQSEEYLSDYDGLTNRQIISKVYQNLFGRPPETEGWDYWETQMNAGWVTISNAAYAILGGAQGTDLDTINNKTKAAQNFTNSLQGAILLINAYAFAGNNNVGHLAKEWLATVSYSIVSLQSAYDNLNSVLVNLVDANTPKTPEPPELKGLVTNNLSVTDIQSLFPAARQYWLDVGVPAEKLEGITFSVRIMDPVGDAGVLARAGKDFIEFSHDASGIGWFVDATPYSHEEFVPHPYADSKYGAFTAAYGKPVGSPAMDGIDLLSVLLHEMGHIIGLGHESGYGNVMDSLNSVGDRYLPIPDNLVFTYKEHVIDGNPSTNNTLVCSGDENVINVFKWNGSFDNGRLTVDSFNTNWGFQGDRLDFTAYGASWFGWLTEDSPFFYWHDDKDGDGTYVQLYEDGTYARHICHVYGFPEYGSKGLNLSTGDKYITFTRPDASTVERKIELWTVNGDLPDAYCENLPIGEAPDTVQLIGYVSVYASLEMSIAIDLERYAFKDIDF
ncbi:MAG: DUF4214 domain-containing protein [Betaproteobacteria bacterium]|nr:DUF4214 domain-containing protein [Betaproteobacteria bacterium]